MYHLCLPEVRPQAARHPGPGLQHAGELRHPHGHHSGSRLTFRGQFSLKDKHSFDFIEEGYLF